MAFGVSWLAVTDSPSLALLRESLEERAVVREAVMGGLTRRSELRELDKQIIIMLGRLGFDPAARSQLGLAEVRVASKLEQLKQRVEGS